MEEVCSFQVTTAIKKLHALKSRKKIIQGGTWAGKTYGIIPLLIDKAARYPNKKITVVAETIPAIKEGALDDFKSIMQETNRWVEERFNSTDRIYKFYNGSRIEFKSFDSIGKAKASGKRTDLFINEGNYISFEIADALMMRTSGDIWVDFNPTHEFWAHTEIMKEEGSEFLLLKYTDNEALPVTILKELEIKREKAKTSSYWANWCKVYIDGEIGSLEGVIFTNWEQIDTIPSEAKYLGTGLDFGFTNDPTAIVDVYSYDGKRILDEVCYQQGLVNKDIADILKEDNKRRTVYADSSEPKSIEEIRRQGVMIKGVVKGNDSVKYGIQTMQDKEYLVTSSSTNVIKEFRAYSWDKDKATGEKLNKPIDEFNHAMDAIRYHEMMSIIKPKMKFSSYTNA